MNAVHLWNNSSVERGTTAPLASILLAASNSDSSLTLDGVDAVFATFQILAVPSWQTTATRDDAALNVT